MNNPQFPNVKVISTRTYDLDAFKAEIQEVAEECTDDNGKLRVTDHTRRYFCAKFYPLGVGWDHVVDAAAAKEKEIDFLIGLGLEGTRTEWGEAPEFALGKLLIALARERASAEVDDELAEAAERVAS